MPSRLCRFICVAVLAVALWPLVQIIGCPHNYYCRAGTQCPEFDESSRCTAPAFWFSEFPKLAFGLRHDLPDEQRRAINKILESASESGRRARVMVLGPNDLHGDAEEWKLYAAKDAQMALVEPIAPIAERLPSRLSFLGFNPGYCPIVNAAICDTKMDGTNTTFFIHRGDHARSTLVPWLNNWDTPFENLDQIIVDCKSASSVLQSIGWSANDIDVLDVDTEGSDIVIVRQFLTLNDFNASIVRFEWIHQHLVGIDIDPTLHWLSAKMYSIFQDGVDIIAIKQRLL